MSEVESKAASLIAHQGWASRPSGNGDNTAVQTCPFCQSTDYKFYINVSGGDQDGLWKCHRCEKTGNLFTLKSDLGLSLEGVMSVKDVALAEQGVSPLHVAQLRLWIQSALLDCFGVA